MFLSLNKRQFQHTIIVYNYYNLANRKTFLKGEHPAINGKRPGSSNETSVQQDLKGRVSKSMRKEGLDPTGGATPVNLIEKGNGDIIYGIKDSPKRQWIITNNGKPKQATKKDLQPWDWKNEDKSWAHYLGFITNRSMIYWYATKWTQLETKARYLGIIFSELVSNIELGEKNQNISISYSRSMVFDKKEFQHFLMLYQFLNLDNFDKLDVMLNEDETMSGRQWESDDPLWKEYMTLYLNRGLKNYFYQRWVNFEPIIKTLGYTIIEDIMYSKLGDFNIRLAV